MRIVVLADIHGNLPALRAVLGEIDGCEPAIDALVVAGDVVGGPYPREVLGLLDQRPEPVLWIRGNADREAIAVWDGESASDDEPGRSAAWSARALDRRWRDRIAAWPISDALGGVRFCHGSPRRDDETLTSESPDDVLREALAGVGETLVVGGHTHRQVIRRLPGGPTYVNAGSVGMPYEGRAAAFWLVIDDGEPRPCETAYDIDAALAELRESGFADVDSQFEESLSHPVEADWVAAWFEHLAGRRDDPGPPRFGERSQRGT